MTIGASHNHTCDCTEVEVTWKIEKESCFKNQVEKNDISISSIGGTDLFTAG